MIKNLACFMMISFLLAGCSNQGSDSIELFVQDGCPHCEDALKYIQINYPRLPIEIMEISTPGNRNRFVLCAEKFRLNKKKLGTPLICMKKRYIMGWSKKNRQLFDKYVQSYLSEK